MSPKKILSVLAWALLLIAPLRAADEKPAVPFRPITFEAACAAAKTAGKLVFIDFYTVWCEPCKRLDHETWTDAAVGKLVDEKAVALKLDAEREGRALAQRYRVAAYPTLLLLKPDGTEVDRMVGHREPLTFMAEFSAGVAGRPAVVRAAQAVAVSAEGHEAVQARYNYARTLAQNGRYAEALEEYLWCYDEGMIKVASFTGVRTSFLTSELGRLAADYPPAREALITRREDAKSRLLAPDGDRRAAAEFSALNDALGDHAASLALFDQLPAGDARRRGFGLRVYADLVAARRYADALEVQPFAAMLRLLDSSLNPSEVIKGNARASLKTHAITNAVTQVEVLAGGGEFDHARGMIAKILAADPSPQTVGLLREKLARAGHPELLAEATAKP